MTELDKMKAGELYDYTAPEVRAVYLRAARLCDEYNSTQYNEAEKREQILRELFGSLGKNPTVLKNLRVDYGFNLHAGDNFFVNYDCVFLDCAPITFGNNVFIAPQADFIRSTTPWTRRCAIGTWNTASPSRWGTTSGSAAASRSCRA